MTVVYPTDIVFTEDEMDDMQISDLIGDIIDFAKGSPSTKAELGDRIDRLSDEFNMTAARCRELLSFCGEVRKQYCPHENDE